MASNTITRTVDDIDGQEGARTHSFSLDGVAYEIDLHPDNFSQFYDSLVKYIENARRVGRVAGGPRASSPVHHGPRSTPAANKAIRDWWRDQVDQGRVEFPAYNERGRIPEMILAAYRAEAEGVSDVPSRTRSKHPGHDEVREVFDQVGSAKGVADHFNVSYPTALGWVRSLPE